MNDTSPYFVALEPDDESLEKVLGWKRRVRELVGSQLYLDDPPHLTLYLAIFRNELDLAAVVKRLAGSLRLPPLEMCGWHVFEADVLTDRNTLVCDLSRRTQDALRAVQCSTVEALADLRDRSQTRARYEPSWQRLPETERTNVETVGFPFVGTIWRPHVSVASILRKDWEAVWAAFASVDPSGPFRLPRLTLYRLEQEHPVVVDRWAVASEERKVS
jgi:2'-5' RNA ligase